MIHIKDYTGRHIDACIHSFMIIISQYVRISFLIIQPFIYPLHTFHITYRAFLRMMTEGIVVKIAVENDKLIDIGLMIRNHSILYESKVKKRWWEGGGKKVKGSLPLSDVVSLQVRSSVFCFLVEGAPGCEANNNIHLHIFPNDVHLP